MRLLIGAAVFACCATAHAQASLRAKPITIGTSIGIASKPLAETRTINVVLPPGYAKDKVRRYPVIYLMDGGAEQDLLHVAGVVQLGAIWGRMGEAILVGIETKDRRRELVGPTKDPELLKKYPTAGSSAAFRAFIRDEVKPLIKRTYRTSGTDVVVGESLAGLFIIETYMTAPDLFDGYAAIDPSLWWDKEALSRTAGKRIGTAQRGKRLYVAVAKEQAEDSAAVERVLAPVQKLGSDLCFARRPDLTHATIYQQVEPQALQFLLPPAEAAPPEFGFEVQCSQKS